MAHVHGARLSWDDFDDAVPFPTSQPAGFQISTQAFAQLHAATPRTGTLVQPENRAGLRQEPLFKRTTTLPSLSLERYLDLVQLLTGGADPATGIGRVKLLSDLERSAVKLDDLKGLLAMNGYAVGGRTKPQLLEAMVGMSLSSPVRIAPPPSEPKIVNIDARDASRLLQEGMQRALAFAAPARAAEVSSAIARNGFYACCPLHEAFLPGFGAPQLRPNLLDIQNNQCPNCLPFQQPVGGPSLLGAIPLTQAQAGIGLPAESSTTVASKPAMNLGYVNDSPDDPMVVEMPEGGQTQVSCAPDWLHGTVVLLSATSQGSCVVAQGSALVGRKVGIVLLDGFQQGGTEEDATVDTLDPGVHIGR